MKLLIVIALVLACVAAASEAHGCGIYGKNDINGYALNNYYGFDYCKYGAPYDLVTKLVKREDFTTIRTSKIQLTFIQENLEFINTLNTVEGTDLEIKNTATVNSMDQDMENVSK